MTTAGHLPYQVLNFQCRGRIADEIVINQLHSIENHDIGLAIFLTCHLNRPHIREHCLAVANTLARELSKRLVSSSTLDSFEESLKVTNKKLEEIYNRFGVLVNCTAVVFQQAQIHFSTVNNGQLYLFRRKKLSSIAFQGRLEEQKIFSAVTSGNLNPSDWLAVGTPELLTVFQRLPTENWQLEAPQEFFNKLTTYITDNPGQLIGSMYQFSLDESGDKTFFWEEAEHHTPLRLPLPAIKLPKFSLPRLPKHPQRVQKEQTAGPKEKTKIKLPKVVISSRTITFVAIGLFLGLAAYGSTLIRHRVKGASTDTVTVPPIISSLHDTSANQLVSFLSTNLTAQTYGSLKAPQQQEIKDAATANNVSLTELPVILKEFPEPLVATTTFDDALLAVDQKGQSWRYQNNTLQQIEQQQAIPNPLSIAAFATDKFLVSDTTGNIWLLDGSATSPVALALPKELGSEPKLLARYNQNLYVLLVNSKLVYKQDNFDHQIDSPALYTKANVLPLANVTSFTIPSQLLAIDQNGKVQDWHRDQLGSYQQSLAPLASNLRITASQDSSVFILNGQILTTLNPKTGQLSTQRLFIADEKLVDIALAPNNQIYLATEKHLYLVNQ